MAKPRAKTKSTFPSLNSADFSRADADQSALAQVKKTWDKHATGWPKDVVETVLRLCKLVKRTASNSNTPSSHKIWKDHPWNFGHWVVMNAIYDSSKLATMKNQLRDSYPSVNFDLMVGPGRPTDKSSDDEDDDDEDDDGEEHISVTAQKRHSRPKDEELKKKLQQAVADTESPVDDDKNHQALLVSTPLKQPPHPTDDEQTQKHYYGRVKKRSSSNSYDYPAKSIYDFPSSDEEEKRRAKKPKKDEIIVSPTRSSSRLQQRRNAALEVGGGSFSRDGGQKTRREIKSESGGDGRRPLAPEYHLEPHQQSIMPQHAHMSWQPWDRGYSNTLPYPGYSYHGGRGYHSGNESISMMDTRDQYSATSSPVPRDPKYVRQSVEDRDLPQSKPRQMSVATSRMDDSESIAVARLRKEMNVKYEAQELRHREELTTLRASFENYVQGIAAELRTGLGELESRVAHIEQQTGV